MSLLKSNMGMSQGFDMAIAYYTGRSRFRAIAALSLIMTSVLVRGFKQTHL